MEDLTQQEQELRARADGIRGKLQDLESELREVDAELEALAPRRAQHELLETACASLERLDELGAASLFWGDGVQPQQAAGILRSVRDRAGAFSTELAAVDGRRQAIAERMAVHQEELEILGEDLYDLREQEERRKLEWLVERDISDVPQRSTVMPWSRRGADDWRLRKTVAVALAASLLAAAVLPMIDLPLPKRFEPEDVPERLAQLVRKELPKPAPKVVEPKPDQPEPRRPEEQKPRPEDPTRPAEQLPDPTREGPALAAGEPAPKQRVQKAGILAFKDKFAGLAKDDVAPKLGEGKRFVGPDDSDAGRPTRAMLTSNAPGSSGGINLGLAQPQRRWRRQRWRRRRRRRDARRGNRPCHELDRRWWRRCRWRPAACRRRPGPVAHRRGDPDRLRPLQGGVLPALQPRAAQRPDLEGTDDPAPDHRAGRQRVDVRTATRSDMDAPMLASQVVDRVLSIDFGAKEGVQALTIVYPIDFLPAA